MEEIYNDEILLTIDLSEATDGFDILDAAAGILDESVKTNFGGQLGECNLLVKGNEGPIPHIHIEAKNKPRFKCHLCIFTPNYFDHEPDDSRLNNSQLKILASSIKRSDWDRFVKTWIDRNMNTESKQRMFENYIKIHDIDLSNLQMPDYTKANSNPPESENKKKDIEARKNKK